jgi:hypothetical protein
MVWRIQRSHPLFRGCAQAGSVLFITHGLPKGNGHGRYSTCDCRKGNWREGQMAEGNEWLRLAPFNFIFAAVAISLAPRAQAQEILASLTDAKPAEVRIVPPNSNMLRRGSGLPPGARSRWFSTTAERKRSTAFSCRPSVFACKQRPARSPAGKPCSRSPENMNSLAICQVTLRRE